MTTTKSYDKQNCGCISAALDFIFLTQK